MAGYSRSDTERALQQIVEEHQVWLRAEEARAEAERTQGRRQQAEQQQPPLGEAPSEFEHENIDFSEYIPPLPDFNPHDTDWMMGLPTPAGPYHGGIESADQSFGQQQLGGPAGYSPGLPGSKGPNLPSFEYQAPMQSSSSYAGPSREPYQAASQYEARHNPPVLPTGPYASTRSGGLYGDSSWQSHATRGPAGPSTSYAEPGWAGPVPGPSYQPSMLGAGLPQRLDDLPPLSSPYTGSHPTNPSPGPDPYGRAFHPAHSTPPGPGVGVPQYSPARPSPGAYYQPASGRQANPAPTTRLEYYHRPHTERPAAEQGLQPGQTVRSVVYGFADRVRGVLNYRQPKLLLQNTAGWTAAQRGEALAIFSEREATESSARLFVYTACLSPLTPATSSIRSEKGQRPADPDFCDAYARASAPDKLEKVLDLVPKRGQPLRLPIVSDTGLAYTTAPLTVEQVQAMMQTSTAASRR